MQYTKWNTTRLNSLNSGNPRAVVEETLMQIGEACSLAYLYELAPGWRQELINVIVGNGPDRESLERTFTLQLAKDAAKKLKDIGDSGIKITFRDKEVPFKAGKPLELPAKKALALFAEFGPHAEDSAKRGILEEPPMVIDAAEA
tara:strand:+ start:371 stop:805 length:435 start_codon:yes stop_codon:yes gene_type:complete